MTDIYLDVAGHGPGLVSQDQAAVPVGDRGFLYGDGLFETMLLREGKVPLLAMHLDRLARSAAYLGMPFDREHAQRATRMVIDALADGGAAEHVVRITLSRGPAGVRGFQPPPEPTPTLMIVARPYSRPMGPLSAITASHRTNERSPLAGLKSLSALEKVIAKGEALRAGCDEALLLNLAGRIAEGAASNLFIVRKGLWMTPPLADGCLPGVMRRRVLELSGGVEWQISPDDLFRCDGVYLTNAVMGCMPLAALDGRQLPWGDAPGFLARLWAPRER